MLVICRYLRGRLTGFFGIDALSLAVSVDLSKITVFGNSSALSGHICLQMMAW